MSRQPTPDILGEVLAATVVEEVRSASSVAIASIRTDGGTQPREGLDHPYIRELAESLDNGATLPPVDVMYDGKDYWLYDGFHRLEAHKAINRVMISAKVHQGDQAAAQWESYAANQNHGLRRSPGDKERAIRAALKHPKGVVLSNSLIGKHLGVSDNTVRKYREMMESASQIAKVTERQGADGKVYSTANIGTNQPARTKTPIRHDATLPALQMPAPGAVAASMAAKIPIEDWELEDFVEQVATEYYGRVTRMVGDSMMLAAQSQAGEYWAKLRRVLEPFDADAPRIEAAVAATVERLVGERRALRPGSPEAKALGKEIKSATWGDTAPGAWAKAIKHTDTREQRVVALADAMLPWIEEWTDDKGRTWRDVADKNPQHANSPFFQDALAECRRQQVPVLEPVVQDAIRAAFAKLIGPIAAEVEADGDRPLPGWVDGGAVEQPAMAEYLAYRETAQQNGDAYLNHRDWCKWIKAGRPVVGAELLDNAVEVVTVRDVDLAAQAQAAPVSHREGYDSDEWYTPGWVIEAATAVMGQIDLDPASCELAQETVQAGLYWSKQQDGCRMAWFGRVWLNPPYSAPGAFVDKLLDEYTAGNVQQACVLLNNATETKWFQRLLARFPVCFFSQRLAFWRHDHEDVGARQGQALFYLGPDVEKFVEVFGEHGIVVKRLD